MKVLNGKLRYIDLCFRRMEVPATWKRDYRWDTIPSVIRLPGKVQSCSPLRPNGGGAATGKEGVVLKSRESQPWLYQGDGRGDGGKNRKSLRVIFFNLGYIFIVYAFFFLD